MAIELNQRLTLAATSDHRLTVIGAQRWQRYNVQGDGLSEWP
jgi:hypothetical protein